MYTYETEFYRFQSSPPTGKEEHIIIRFTHYRTFESLPDHGRALENFVDKAWEAAQSDPRYKSKPGWSSWIGGHKFKRIRRKNNG